MRFPLWYVLASEGESLHRDLAVISARVLRHVDPSAVIGIVCDQQSADAAVRDHVSLGSAFDHVVVRPSAESSAMQRSRSLKLRLRLEQTGDFVYVDSDTLALSPLNDWPDAHASVMFAFDYKPGHSAHSGAPDGAIKKLQQIGWPTPVPRYFNGGVAVWKDDAVAHRFATAWYDNWRFAVSAGVNLDQPALAHTDRELGGVVQPLPPRFNAQINAWAGFAPGAKLWHFWLSQVRDETGPASILEHLLSEYQRTGDVDFDRFQRCRARGFPWVKSQGFRPYWLTRNYSSAIAELPRSAARYASQLFKS